MKKLVFVCVVIALFLFGCGNDGGGGSSNNSIVGYWEWYSSENNYGGLVFSSDGTGYSWYWDTNHYSKSEMISWTQESENLITFLVKSDDTGNIYKENIEFYINGDILVCCEEDDDCSEYTRKDEPNPLFR